MIVFRVAMHIISLLHSVYIYRLFGIHLISFLEYTMIMCTLLFRKKPLNLAEEQTLYLIVNDKTMIGSQTLEEVYNTFKDTDGWLHIKYSSREVPQELSTFIPTPFFKKN